MRERTPAITDMMRGSFLGAARQMGVSREDIKGCLKKIKSTWEPVPSSEWDFPSEVLGASTLAVIFMKAVNEADWTPNKETKGVVYCCLNLLGVVEVLKGLPPDETLCWVLGEKVESKQDAARYFAILGKWLLGVATPYATSSTVGEA